MIKFNLEILEKCQNSRKCDCIVFFIKGAVNYTTDIDESLKFIFENVMHY